VYEDIPTSYISTLKCRHQHKCLPHFMICLTFQVWIGLGKHFSWHNMDSRRQNSNLLKVWEGPLTDLCIPSRGGQNLCVHNTPLWVLCFSWELIRETINAKRARKWEVTQDTVWFVFVLSVCSHLQETSNNPPNTWNSNFSSYYELTCRKCIVKKTDSWYYMYILKELCNNSLHQCSEEYLDKTCKQLKK